MSKQRDLRGAAAPAPAGAGASGGIKKQKAWWRRRRPDNAPRPVTLVGDGGQVFIGRRLPEAWVWVEAETAPGAEAANDPAFGGKRVK